MDAKKKMLEVAVVETPGNYTILVVEDESSLNHLIQKILRRADFRTDGVENGTEAVEYATKHPETLLLLDYLIPQMNGKQVIEALIEKACNIPFIIMTGYGDQKIAVEMMKLGAREYIIKDPGFIEVLPQVVGKVIGELEKEERLTEAEGALRKNEKKLVAQNLLLDRKNVALGEILNQLDIEKKNLEARLVTNIDLLLLPVLEQMKIKGHGFDDKCIKLIENTIKNITSSFGQTLANQERKLSAREIDICNMIKNSMTTKEIARMLSISTRTVESHRNNIRKKLQINDKSITLLTFFKSL